MAQDSPLHYTVSLHITPAAGDRYDVRGTAGTTVMVLSRENLKLHYGIVVPPYIEVGDTVTVLSSSRRYEVVAINGGYSWLKNPVTDEHQTEYLNVLRKA